MLMAFNSMMMHKKKVMKTQHIVYGDEIGDEMHLTE